MFHFRRRALKRKTTALVTRNHVRKTQGEGFLGGLLASLATSVKWGVGVWLIWTIVRSFGGRASSPAERIAA